MLSVERISCDRRNPCCNRSMGLQQVLFRIWQVRPELPRLQRPLVLMLPLQPHQQLALPWRHP